MLVGSYILHGAVGVESSFFFWSMYDSKVLRLYLVRRNNLGKEKKGET